MYLDGFGVPQDDTRALEYYQQARAAGSDAATAGLGRMYLEGLGVPLDYTRALEYYQQARAAGVAEASTELGGVNCAALAAAWENASSGCQLGLPQSLTLQS